jgi:RNA recognition motif-containing protein
MAEEHAGEEQTVRIGKRCYVGNLAWRTSWQDLKDKFRECGNVVYANVMNDDTGRSKGWGIVEFETPEEALKAINTLNGEELSGRRLLVREDREDRDVKPAGEAPRSGRGPARSPAGRGRGRGARGGRGPAPERTGESSGMQIVVQGIPWSWTWQELKDYFSEYAVDRADVVSTPEGRSKGFGVVRFFSLEDASAAVEKFHGSELEGRTLSVFIDKYA